MKTRTVAQEQGVRYSVYVGISWLISKERNGRLFFVFFLKEDRLIGSHIQSRRVLFGSPSAHKSRKESHMHEVLNEVYL